jgi:hypothetical protein
MAKFIVVRRLFMNNGVRKSKYGVLEGGGRGAQQAPSTKIACITMDTATWSIMRFVQRQDWWGTKQKCHT